ncbi:MAG: FAD-dependent thymidylate synthase [Myxococcota bacterium]
MCDEVTGEILHTRVVDVWETGTRPVFRVTLDNGYSIQMTRDHRCLTEQGWKTLGQATDVAVGDTGAVAWRGDAPAFAVNGVPAHRDPEWLAGRRAEGLGIAEMAARAGVTGHTIRKCLKQHGLQFTPAERAKLSGAAQRGQKRHFTRKPLAPQARANVVAARSGARSNFWKGGIAADRANIARWTKEHAARVHERFGWRCVLCGGKDRLHAHHVDPVWHAPEKARDEANLVSLCFGCHNRIHAHNLELLLLEASRSGSLSAFWDNHDERRPRPAGKRLPRVRKLVRAWARVVKIEYVGELPTYDLEVEGPFHNFVANGFVVHNSVNEYSARYSILDREFYLPRPEDLAVQSKDNKQGRGDPLTAEQAAFVLDLLRRDAVTSYDTYEKLMGDVGLARELARMNLPVNFYTQWYWKIDLHNLLHFLSLRIDPHAQYEIRVYGEAIASVVKAWVPHVWEAFEDYRLGAVTLSRQMMDVVRRMLAGEAVTREQTGLSKREWDELMEALGR